ncbi:hypothetical protein GCM10010841_07910 [Deinococcus aerophilus]|uniref:3D domain-containing protein n=2 Tax=Deinococcus aerophilus TaxID=522488 RepID=A0ABQ2GL80_9DEIO|nr:hypothetical protein GCM10010841_07910 [Deinococcus aerophilus]
MYGVLFGIASVAAATPALPGSALATDAVRGALVVPVKAPAPVAQTPPVQQKTAEQNRAAAIAQEAAVSATVAQSVVRGRSAVVRATAYNSLASQTDSTPFITATGTRTRPGVVALSRDLLRQFPYGSKIMIEDLSGRYNRMLKGRIFIVEDTMAARKTNSLDIWMSTRSEAINFGARQVRITAVR